jgi:hypothetical protein
MQATIAATLCALVMTGSTAAFSQASVTRIPRHLNSGTHRMSQQEKAASDQAMKAGLNYLQAAASAMQSNNAQGVGNNLVSARNAMLQAKPIYDGHREASIKSTEDALKEMRGTTTEAGKRVAEHLSRAIQDAQAAVQTN